jgi:hypothetical protein
MVSFSVLTVKKLEAAQRGAKKAGPAKPVNKSMGF